VPLLLLLATIYYPTILFVEFQVLLGVYMMWMPRDEIRMHAHA